MFAFPTRFQPLAVILFFVKMLQLYRSISLLRLSTQKTYTFEKVLRGINDKKILALRMSAPRTNSVITFSMNFMIHHNIVS